MTSLSHVQAAVILALAAAAGCMPPGPPYQVMETAEALRRGEVQVTVGGGAGVLPPQGGSGSFWGAGAGTRVRIGLGARQEVGIEAAVNLPVENAVGSLKDGFGAAKLSYKAGLLPWMAFIGSFGFGIGFDSRNQHNAGIGGDLALVASTPSPVGRIVRPYAAFRTVLGGPVAGNAPILDFGLLGAGGLSLEPTSTVRIYVEVGGGGLFRFKDAPGDKDQVLLGLYGGAGVAYVFGRRDCWTERGGR